MSKRTEVDDEWVVEYGVLPSHMVHHYTIIPEVEAEIVELIVSEPGLENRVHVLHVHPFVEPCANQKHRYFAHLEAVLND